MSKDNNQQSATKPMHTPGTWHTSGRNILDEYGNKVAEAATARHIVEGSPKANARLIAAAPELLAALEEVVNSADAGGWATLDPMLKKQRDAIAKAEVKS